MKKQVEIKIPATTKKGEAVFCDVCNNQISNYPVTTNLSRGYSDISLEHFKEENDSYSKFDYSLKIDVCNNCYDWNEYSKDVAIIEQNLLNLFIEEYKKIEKKLKNKQCKNEREEQL